MYLFIDACENVKCGGNAECIAARHNHQCKCKPGYVGTANSEIGCKLQEKTCSSKKDCSNDQYCHKNVCKGKSIRSNFIQRLLFYYTLTSWLLQWVICFERFQGYVLLMRNVNPKRNVTMGVVSTLVKWKRLVELTHYAVLTTMYFNAVALKVSQEIKIWNVWEVCSFLVFVKILNLVLRLINWTVIIIIEM